MGVILIGSMTCPPDRLDAVRAALAEHIRLTRAEEGCVRFDVVESKGTAGLFYVSEAFTDQAAFDAHQTRASASTWAEVTQGLPRDYVIKTVD